MCRQEVPYAPELQHVLARTQRNPNILIHRRKRGWEDDVVFPEMLNHLLSPKTGIEHHEVGVGIDGTQHSPVDFIQELLSIVCILLHAGLNMLDIAECGCGSPCCDSVHAKRQSISSEQAGRARSGDPISD